MSERARRVWRAAASAGVTQSMRQPKRVEMTDVAASSRTIGHSGERRRQSTGRRSSMPLTSEFRTQMFATLAKDALRKNGVDHPKHEMKQDVFTEVDRAHSRLVHLETIARLRAAHEDETVDEEGVRARALQIAGLYIMDALHGRRVVHAIDDLGARLYTLYYSGAYQALYGLLLLGYLIGLTTFERAHTCSSPLQAGDQLLAGIELGILVVLWADGAVQYRLRGPEYCRKNAWFIVKMLTLLLLTIDVLSVLGGSGCRFSRVLRPVLVLCRFVNVRRVWTSMWQAVPGILNVILLITFQIVFFAFLGHLLFKNMVPAECAVPPLDFDDMPAANCSTTQNREHYFGSLSEAAMQLFILLTTANFPDIMMPYFRVTRWSALFFVAFLLLGLFFLMNLLLAVVYNNYKEKSAGTIVRKRLIRRAAAFVLVFDTLLAVCPDNSIPWELVEPLLRKIRPDLPQDVLPVLYEAMREEGDPEALDSSQFMELCHLATLVRVRDVIRLKRPEEQATMRERMQALLMPIADHPWTRYILDALVLLNCVLLFLQVAVEDSTEISLTRKDDERVLATALHVVLGLFTCELLFMILVFGWKRYWLSAYNRVDFLSVFFSLLNEIVSYYRGGFTANVFAIFRVFRLFRVLRLLKNFSTILTSAKRMLPALMRLLGVAAVITYVFSILGMELFSGKLDNVTQSTYAGANYYENNFNSFGESLIVLFELLVVNNWHVLMDGAVEATNWRARFYFVAFIIVAVLLVSNVVIAFIIDTFVSQYDSILQEKEGKHETWMAICLSAQRRVYGDDPRYEFFARQRFNDLYLRMFANDLPPELTEDYRELFNVLDAEEDSAPAEARMAVGSKADDSDDEPVMVVPK